MSTSSSSSLPPSPPTTTAIIHISRVHPRSCWDRLLHWLPPPSPPLGEFQRGGLRLDSSLPVWSCRGCERREGGKGMNEYRGEGGIQARK